MKEYLEMRIKNIEDNTELARMAIEVRLQGMNEFRDALKDQASRFITRQELEAKLSNMQIVDVRKIPNQGKVVFGTKVTLCHVDTGAEITYQLVGVDEADIKLNKISYSSPIGRAVIGKFVDDAVVEKKLSAMMWSGTGAPGRPAKPLVASRTCLLSVEPAALPGKMKV